MAKSNLNFRLSSRQLSARFIGYGGIRTEHILQPKEKFHGSDPKRHTAAKFTRAIREFEPDTVLIMIGDNDIRSDSDPDTIAAHIIVTGSTIKRRHNIKNVVICLLLPRIHDGSSEYNRIAWQVNERILHDAPLAGLIAHDHGFRFPQWSTRSERLQDELNFVRDGVHLVEARQGGYAKLVRSLRHVAISLSKNVIGSPHRLLVLGHSHVKRVERHLRTLDNAQRVLRH